jgi:hypothetical protein
VPRTFDEGLDLPGVPGEGDEKDLHASMRTGGTSIRVSTGSRGVGEGGLAGAVTHFQPPPVVDLK